MLLRVPWLSTMAENILSVAEIIDMGFLWQIGLQKLPGHAILTTPEGTRSCGYEIMLIDWLLLELLLRSFSRVETLL